MNRKVSPTKQIAQLTAQVADLTAQLKSAEQSRDYNGGVTIPGLATVNRAWLLVAKAKGSES